MFSICASQPELFMRNASARRASGTLSKPDSTTLNVGRAIHAASTAQVTSPAIATTTAQLNMKTRRRAGT